MTHINMATFSHNRSPIKERRCFEDKSLVVVVFAWITVCYSMPCVYGSSLVELVTVPDDQTVREGDTVTFICILQTNLTIVSAIAFWEDGLAALIPPHPLISNSTEVNRTTGTRDYPFAF